MTTPISKRIESLCRRRGMTVEEFHAKWNTKTAAVITKAQLVALLKKHEARETPAQENAESEEEQRLERDAGVEKKAATLAGNPGPLGTAGATGSPAPMPKVNMTASAGSDMTKSAFWGGFNKRAGVIDMTKRIAKKAKGAVAQAAAPQRRIAKKVERIPTNKPASYYGKNYPKPEAADTQRFKDTPALREKGLKPTGELTAEASLEAKRTRAAKANKEFGEAVASGKAVKLPSGKMGVPAKRATPKTPNDSQVAHKVRQEVGAKHRPQIDETVANYIRLSMNKKNLKVPKK